MANCCNCSAPLPPNSIKCEYCGSRNDTDLKGVHHYTTHEIESERVCPRCSIRLRTIDLKVHGKFLIERCDECLGLFFDPGELEALLEATVSNVFTIDRSRLDNVNATMGGSDYGALYIKCPTCSKVMNRVNFGAKSGVIVHRCKDHGIWLDGGDLRHLFEWMKAGGKLLQQEREEQLKAEKQHEKERQSRPAPSSAGDYVVDSDTGYFGGTLRTEDPDLFYLVRAAMNFFLK